MGVYYIQPSLASDDSIVRCQEYFLYTYTGVRLSALLVSDEQGNAKALTSGTSDRTGSTLFMYIYQPFINQANMVAVGIY